MIRPLNALKASLLMLARRLRRFLRLSLEKPLTLSLMPLPRRIGGLSWLLVLVSSKESVDTDPSTVVGTGLSSFRLFMNGLSVCCWFGVRGGLRGARRTTGVPLSVGCSLHG